jgi:NADPH2:quinone reductase
VGACLGIPALTADHAVTMDGGVAGTRVLVAGGAGAVGNAAIQLARWCDARVITTVSSPEKANLAARAGADHVIDYRRQDVVAETKAIAPGGVNTVVEVAAAANAGIDVPLLARFGTVAVYADDGGRPLEVPVRPLMQPNARFQFVLVYTAPDDWRARALDDVSAAVMEGAARVGEEAGLPLHHYPLEQTVAAHAAVEGGAVGKVIVDVVP